MPLRDPQHVLWNLFLAAVPVALAFVIAHGLRRQRRAGERLTWALWGPLLLVWLAFLPNTCYLLTEWRHYLQTLATNPVLWRAQQGGQAMVDFLVGTGFYVLYTGVGLLTFFLAVWPLDRLARGRLGGWVWPLQGGVFVLCPLGVYLGLIPRFNTWDLLHPTRLTDILAVTLGVQERPLLLGFLFGFGGTLWILYTLFDIWMDGAALRLRSRRERKAAPTASRRASPEEWHHASS